MHIRKDDQVEVIAGDDKGTPADRRIAKVLRVLPEKNKIVVEGVNRVYKHMQAQPARTSRAAGSPRRCRSTSPTSCSSAPRATAGVRVGHRFTDAGQKQRYCKACGGQPGQRRPASSRPRAGQEASLIDRNLARDADDTATPNRRRHAATALKDDRDMARLLDQYNTTIATALAAEVQPRRTRWRSPSWRRSSSTWASAGPPRTRPCWTRPSTA